MLCMPRILCFPGDGLFAVLPLFLNVVWDSCDMQLFCTLCHMHNHLNPVHTIDTLWSWWKLASACSGPIGDTLKASQFSPLQLKEVMHCFYSPCHFTESGWRYTQKLCLYKKSSTANSFFFYILSWLGCISPDSPLFPLMLHACFSLSPSWCGRFYST